MSIFNRKKSHKRTIALIGGSGLAQGLEGIFDSCKRVGPRPNRFGWVLSHYVGQVGDTRVIVLPRHGDSEKASRRRTPAQLVDKKGYEANIWLLHKKGVEAVYASSAFGALDLDVPLADTYRKPDGEIAKGHGTFVLPSSYVRGAAASQHSFGNKANLVHTPMRDGMPFSSELNGRLKTAAETCGHFVLENGLYVYNGGDTFETPEEVAKLELETRFVRDCENPRPRGLGMTTVPEAMLLRQMEIPFAVLAANVNWAEGLNQETIVSHEQTMKVMGTAGDYAIDILAEVLRQYSP